MATALASGLCQADPLAQLIPLLGRSDDPCVGRWGAGALLDLVLGSVAREQNALLFAQLGKATPADGEDQARAFAHGVEALVAGLLGSAMDIKE